MPSPMTKSQLLAHLSEETELPKKKVAELLEVLAETAYSQAKNGFTLPGLGKLVLVNRKARKGRNPATGEEITIAAKPASVDVRARPLAKAKGALPSVQKARRRLAA